MSETPSGSANKTAPYTSFKSLKTLIGKEHYRIDPVLRAFRARHSDRAFLELIEDGGHPTESMSRLVRV